jgi:signal transduction histidine kinase
MAFAQVSPVQSSKGPDMRRLFNRLKSFAKLTGAFWIGFVVSGCVAVVFYVATARIIESDAYLRFANHARGAQSSISAQIKSYTDLLRSAASFAQTSDRITREQFHAYVIGLKLEQHFPAMESVNYAEYVPGNEREKFLRRVRAEQVAHPFSDRVFSIVPPGERPDYAVLTLIELSNVKASAFGFDVLSTPAPALATRISRDTGALVASGYAVAAISKPGKIGLAMRLPVYRPGQPLDSVSERRAAYIGSIGIAFSVPKLVIGALRAMPVKNVRMVLSDFGPGEVDSNYPSRPVRVLFDSAATAQKPAPSLLRSSDRFVTSLPIDYNGRPWTATFDTPKASLYTQSDEYFPLLAMAAGFIGSMLIYALFHTMATSRTHAIKLAVGMTSELRESQTKLQLSHQRLRRLAAHADQIKEVERKRIAREIHDDLGQNLLALRIEADLLASRTSAHHPRLHERAHTTLLQIDSAIKSVRQIINDLRPNVLDLGLSAAVEWQIAQFIQRTGIACQLIVGPDDIDIHDDCATAFFRILQESLTNIVRHAKASAVRVELNTNERDLWMSITDNGIGMPDGGRHKPGSFGLVGIEERINILGGSFSIQSTVGCGTSVFVSVPISEELRHAVAAAHSSTNIADVEMA